MSGTGASGWGISEYNLDVDGLNECDLWCPQEEGGCQTII